MLSESPVNNKCFNIIKGFIFDAAITDASISRENVKKTFLGNYKV